MPYAAATPRRRSRRTPNLKFSQKLVLNQWVLSLFEVNSLERLVGDLKDERLEAYDENIILNSFIVTPTRYSDPGWWTGGLTKAEFEARHVFFQQEDADT